MRIVKAEFPLPAVPNSISITAKFHIRCSRVFGSVLGASKWAGHLAFGIRISLHRAVSIFCYTLELERLGRALVERKDRSWPPHSARSLSAICEAAISVALSIDLMAAVAGSALIVAIDYRQDLFAGVPIVFCSVDRRDYDLPRGRSERGCFFSPATAKANRGNEDGGSGTMLSFQQRKSAIFEV
jgi:hypothetical protein